MATAKITKLEAVNMLLDAIGEDRVSSLQSGLADAEKAEAKIDEISRELQSRGYWCNTVYGLTLSPDSNGNIILPSNALKVDTSEENEFERIATRGNKLYDLENNTLVFDHDIKVDIVQVLDFDDLPFELQNFIVCRAGRVFQEGAMGSASLDGFTKRREMEAQTSWEASVADVEDSNVIRDSASVRVIALRRNRIFGA